MLAAIDFPPPRASLFQFCAEGSDDTVQDIPFVEYAETLLVFLARATNLFCKYSAIPQELLTGIVNTCQVVPPSTEYVPDPTPLNGRQKKTKELGALIL